MEEDIKILEDFINNEFKRDKLEIDDRCGGFKMGHIYKITELSPAIEYLLKAYKELKEENESKQKAYDNCYCEFKHYKQYESIPISLVEEKIEELKQRAISYGLFIDKDESFNIQSKISILQELLEKR